MSAYRASVATFIAALVAAFVEFRAGSTENSTKAATKVTTETPGLSSWEQALYNSNMLGQLGLAGSENLAVQRVSVRVHGYYGGKSLDHQLQMASGEPNSFWK